MCKKVFFLFCLATVCITLLTGCGTVEETLYFGDIDTKAPIALSPVRAMVSNEPGSFTISPRIILHSGSRYETTTSNSYRKHHLPFDTSTVPVRSKNLHWESPKLTADFTFDFIISQRIALTGTFRYSVIDNIDLSGGSLGIGILGKLDNPTLRLDGGITFQQNHYDATTVVYTKTTSPGGSVSEKVTYFRDIGKATNFNPYLTITLASVMPASIFNYSVTAGYFTQNIIGFEPEEIYFPNSGSYSVTDLRSDYTAGFIYIQPAAVLTVSEHIRLLVSAAFLKEVANSTYDPVFFLPSIQMFWSL